MRIRTIAGLSAVALMAGLAGAALAQEAVTDPQMRSVNIDNAKVEGTRVISRGEGQRSIETNVTRKSDGATASKTDVTTRTENGFITSMERTGFEGQTSSRTLTRNRTEGGYTETGSITTPAGQTLSIAGSGVRTETGATRSRSLTNAEGAVLASRTGSIARENGQIVRTNQVVRPQGANNAALATGRQQAMRAAMIARRSR